MTTLQEYINTSPIYVQMLIASGFALLVATLVVVLLYAALRASARKTRSFTLEAFVKRTRTTVFWLLAMLLTYWFWASIHSRIDTDNLPFYLPGFSSLSFPSSCCNSRGCVTSERAFCLPLG